MSTVDKIMALADNYRAIGTHAAAMIVRDDIRAAIVEALDMGEPVAWISDREQLQRRMGDKPGAHWRPLYAAKP